MRSFRPECLNNFRRGWSPWLPRARLPSESDWGIWQRKQAIPLRVTASKAISIVKKANERGQLMSLNFNMYQDGQVTPETLAMFRELTAAIYAKPE